MVKIPRNICIEQVCLPLPNLGFFNENRIYPEVRESCHLVIYQSELIFEI